MAKRRRKSQSQLDKAAIGIGRVLGKALNRIEKIRAKRKKVTKRTRTRTRATGSGRRATARRAPRRKATR